MACSILLSLLLFTFASCVGVEDPLLGESRLENPGEKRDQGAGQAPDRKGSDKAAAKTADLTKRVTLPVGIMHPLQGHQQLVEAVGTPRKEEIREKENRHDPELTDTVITWSWPGLSCTFTRSGYDGREFMLFIELGSPGWALPGGIGPGMSRSELAAAYGEPDRIEGNRLIYLSEPLSREFLLAGEGIKTVRVIAFSP
jgi:hypothetical protein